MFKCNEQAITDIQGCCRDLNQLSTLQGYKPNNMTHVGQEGSTSGNSSRHDQRVELGPTSPQCHLPRVCLARQTVGGPNTIPLYPREGR
jgi:hypothetical protein